MLELTDLTRGTTSPVVGLGRDGDQTFFRTLDPGVTVSVAPFPDLAEETVGQRVLRSIATLKGWIDVEAFDIRVGPAGHRDPQRC